MTDLYPPASRNSTNASGGLPEARTRRLADVCEPDVRPVGRSHAASVGGPGPAAPLVLGPVGVTAVGEPGAEPGEVRLVDRREGSVPGTGRCRSLAVLCSGGSRDHPAHASAPAPPPAGARAAGAAPGGAGGGFFAPGREGPVRPLLLRRIVPIKNDRFTRSAGSAV